jgi:hypothetical protein
MGEGRIERVDGAGLEVGVKVGLPKAQGAAGVGELDAPFGHEAVDEAPAAAEVVGGAVDVVEAVAGVDRRSGAGGARGRSRRLWPLEASLRGVRCQREVIG